MKIKVIEPAQVGTKYSFLREEEQKKTYRRRRRLSSIL